MADNIQLNSGSGGATLATDDDGTAHHQYVKVEFGADNTQTPVSAANPMPVDASGNAVPVTDNGGALTVDNGGTFAVQAAQSGSWTVDLGSNNDVQGAAAEGAAVSGNPFLIAGDDGTNVKHVAVDSSGNVQVVQSGSSVSTNNSSTSTLTSGSTFTGTGDEVTQYAGVSVYVEASHDSGTDGLKIEFSSDNSNWDVSTSFTYIAAAGGQVWTAPTEGQYFRVTYTNGGTGQTHFRIQTLLHRQPVQADRGRVADNVSAEKDASLVKAAIVAQQSGIGDFIPVSSSASGKLQVAAEIEDGGNSITVDSADLTTLSGAVSGTEMQVDVVASLPAGTNAIGKLAANSGVDIGDVDVTSISAGSNLIGDVGISGARTSGGTTLYRNTDVDETEDEVKGTAGQLYWIHAMNLTASVLYLQIYNKAAASVTVGTTTPDLTFPLATQGDTNGAGFTFAIPNGIALDTGLTVACTTTIGGSSGPAANGCVVNLGYA